MRIEHDNGMAEGGRTKEDLNNFVRSPKASPDGAIKSDRKLVNPSNVKVSIKTGSSANQL
jgi:hypothetical protein